MAKKSAAMLGPREAVSRKAVGVQLPIEINQYQISFDSEAFNQLLRTHGVRLVHYRAIPDPRGMLSRGDARSAGLERRSSDGFIYKEIGTVTGFFANNSSSIIESPEHTMAHATSYVSLPQTYDNCNEPVLLANWDRLFVADIELRVVTSQFLEANRTGLDTLSFPATCVEHLMDSNGTEYKEKTDFEITPDGQIKWLNQNRPGFDHNLGRGTVYSIRYRYTPFFIVNRLIHEIRIANITNPATFTRDVKRMNYFVEVVREHVFQDVNRNENSFKQDDPRYINLPSAGGTLGN